MNPWKRQKQSEKTLPPANPQPKKQESEMAFDPLEDMKRMEYERQRLQEYYLQKQKYTQMQQQVQRYYYPDFTDEPQKPLEKSASTECIVGLRVWKVVDDNGLPKLASVVKSSVLWPYRKPLERDPIMAEGIHAVKPGDRVLSLFCEYDSHVAGEVYLWGKVIECAGGYLAESAYPKKLLVPSDFDPIKAMQLEDEYGVPCEFREELKPRAKKTADAMLMQQAMPNSFPQGLLSAYGLSWQP